MDREARPLRLRAFQRLYGRHRHELYERMLAGTGSAPEAERLTQAALLDAYWAYTRGETPPDPRGWLFQLAERARRRRRLLERVRTVEEPEQRAVADLDRALDRLDGDERSVLLLRELAGYSYDEIAEELDVPPAQVETLLFRARRSLRAAVERRRRLVALPFPMWLGNVVTWGERVAPGARAAGVAAAAAVTVGVAVGTGAAPGEAAQRPAAAPGVEPRAERPASFPEMRPAPAVPVTQTAVQSRSGRAGPAETRSAAAERKPAPTSRPAPAAASPAALPAAPSSPPRRAPRVDGEAPKRSGVPADRPAPHRPVQAVARVLPDALPEPPIELPAELPAEPPIELPAELPAEPPVPSVPPVPAVEPPAAVELPPAPLP